MSTLAVFSPTRLISALRSRLPSSPPTWRATLIIILLLLNLKALPAAWHIRLLYRFFHTLHSTADVARSLSSLSSSTKTQKTRQHPIFTPVTIRTHSPLLEIDFNLHKSNSTYFSDLDESRTALVAKVLGPAFFARRPSGAREQSDKSLEEQGVKGRVAVILGSVHCSFHKEVAAYTGYEVRSRVLGWDRKWLVIGSWMVRKGRKGEEVLLASALSKYVVKKGRYTVSPERCLRVAGWLPEKGAEEVVEDSAVLVPGTEESGLEGREEVQETAEEGGEEVLEAKIAAAAESTADDDGPWDWNRIEKERLRGLKIAEEWLALDAALKGEFETEV